jgi:YesN/AraC family two-component response regulator
MVEQAAGSSPHHIHPRRLRRAEVLLVDDDPACLEALAGTLQHRLGHFTLDTSDTGTKALDYVTTKHYDTIIADVNMPGMNGIHFLRRVRQLRPLASVVMISGHADHALVATAIDAGAADFIAKPIERDILIYTVRRTLHLSRLRALLDHRRATIGRARDHYLSIVQKLGDSNERWLGSLDSILKADAGGVPQGALFRQQKAEEQMDILTKRTTRHLAMLDAFLFNATQAHQQTAEELTIAEDRLRSLALTRLQGRP